MKKRILAMILVVVLVFSLAATSLAASFTDVDKDYWAADAIERWADAGVLSGVGNDKYNPEGLVTRGQAAVIFANLLKLEESADLSKFYDMDHWSAPFVAKVYAAGIMNGLTNYLMGPEEHMSREQFFTMFAVAMGIEGQQFCMKSFTDYNDASAYALPYINALVNLGYLSGRTATTLAPKLTMKRAEIASLLDRVITAYVTKDNETVTVEGNGIVLVVANNVTVVGDNFTGTAVATGDADKVTVTGSFNGSINVSNAGASVSLSGLTGQVTVNANASGVQVNNAPNGTTVTAKDDVTNVTVNGGAVQEDSSVTVGGTPSTPPVVVDPPYVPPYVPPVEDEECEHTNLKYLPSQLAYHHDIYCDDCGEELDTTVPCTMETTTPPTCVAPGVQTCKYCDTSYNIDATGHDTDGDGDWDCTCKPEDAWKFTLSVTSKNTVSATVYNDYSAYISLPVDGTVATSGLDIHVGMKNVASLGVTEKSHDWHLNTNLTIADQDLHSWLEDVYAFETKTNLKVFISDAGSTSKYPAHYTIFGDGNGNIYAQPNFISSTRNSWAFLTNDDHLAVTEQNVEDSFINVGYGSFFKVGDQMLRFEYSETPTDLEVRDMDDLNTLVRPAVTLETLASDDGKIVAVLTAGTKLAVGYTVATLKEDVTVTVTGATVDGEIMKTLRDGTTSEMIQALIEMVNEVVGSVEGKTVNVDIVFGHVCKPVLVTEATCTTPGTLACADGCVGTLGTIPATGHAADWSCGHNAAASTKVEVKVESGEIVDDNAATVTVYDDYAAKIVLPDGKVSASLVKVSLSMKDVASLGVPATGKSASITLETNLTQTPELTNWLDCVYLFEAADVKVNVQGAAGFTYAVVGGGYVPDGKTVITATPDSVDNARAAWKALTGHVETTEVAGDDSSLFIPYGSYLTVGGETLCFEETETGKAGLKIDNINDFDALKATAKAAVKVVDAGTTTGLTACLKKDTVLRVGSSVATLKDDVIITITGLDEAAVAGILGDVRDAVNMSMYDMLAELVGMVNQLVDSVDGCTGDDAIVVNVSFN